MCNVNCLATSVTGAEMHGKNLREGSVYDCWIDASAQFQISGTKFL